MLGTIYIVATPIGNLQDITLRAIKILSEVDIILAEDTRVTRKLLHSLDSKYGILSSKLMSYHQHSSEKKKLEILNMLLKGKNIALVTDAGTPGISDPGNELIVFITINNPNINIVPLPGASSLTSALSVSGFPTNKFIFLGFLPKKKRKKLFEWIRSGSMTFAFFESPKRLMKTLDVIEDYFGKETEVFIARELTKLHETLYRGSLSVVRSKMSDLGKVKGEIVVIVKQ